MKPIALLVAAALTAACAPSAEDWSDATTAESGWLDEKGLGLYGPLPSIAVVSPEHLAANHATKGPNDGLLYGESKAWVARREIRAMAFPALRVVQFSDRLDPARARDRTTMTRELFGIACFDRGWCQSLPVAAIESWQDTVQALRACEQ